MFFSLKKPQSLRRGFNDFYSPALVRIDNGAVFQRVETTKETAKQIHGTSLITGCHRMMNHSFASYVTKERKTDAVN